MADRHIFGNQGPVDPHLKRSTFDKSFLNNLTCRPGLLYPILVEECPANSSYSIDADFAFDMMPLWYPVQNNITAHVQFYRVPFRILMKHYRRFFGQIGKDGQINGTLNYEMPYIKRAPGWCEQGSLADYMGLPTNFYSEREVFKNMEEAYLRIAQLWDNDVLSLYPFGSTTTASEDATEGFALRFRFPAGRLPSTAKMRVAFAHEPSLNLSDYETAMQSVSTSMSLLFSPSTISTRANGNVISYKIPITSFRLRSIDTYDVSGTSVALSYMELTLDPTAIANYNSNPYYYENGGYGAIFMTGTDGGAVPASLLMSRGNFNVAIPDASTVTLDKSSEDGDYIIRPTISSYGFTYVATQFIQPSLGSRHHFSSISGSNPKIPINALPFRAYEFIANYYFRNPRIDPFMKYSDETGNLQPCYDEYITNDGDGADETTPIDFVHVPWEYDMFTTAVKEPFFGNAPLVGIQNNLSETGELTSATFTMRSQEGDTYTFQCKTNPQGKIVGIDYSSVAGGNTANSPVFNALNYAIEAGITISDFRNANALTRWMEKQARSGVKFENLMEEFFGSRPPLGEEYPTYLGGCTRRIMVNKITNTAQSDGNPLGDFAGTGSVSGSSKRIRMYTSEPCYIMGLLYFTTTPLYSQMLPKHFIKSKLLDYYNPLFANISPQPIYCKQLAPLQLGDDEIDDVFGYGRPYADYVSRQDEVHGEFRGSMADFLFQRIFKDKPRLNKSFIEINSADLTNIFANNEDNDKFFGQIYFSIRAKLPLPRFSVPQII